MITPRFEGDSRNCSSAVACKIKIDRCYEVLSRLWFNVFDLFLNVTATVNNDFTVAIAPAQACRHRTASMPSTPMMSPGL